MPPEFLALIETPLPLIAILFAGVFIGMTIEKFRAEMRWKAWRERKRRKEENRTPWPTKRVPEFPKTVPEPPKKPDAADQLRIVMGAHFTIQPLLNKNE